MLKKCKIETCGKEFESTSNNAKYCPECYTVNRGKKLKEQYELNRKPKKPKQKRIKIDLSINEVVRLMEQYNREHKTGYTYGSFIELIRNGKIKMQSVKRKV